MPVPQNYIVGDHTHGDKSKITHKLDVFIEFQNGKRQSVDVDQIIDASAFSTPAQCVMNVATAIGGDFAANAVDMMFEKQHDDSADILKYSIANCANDQHLVLLFTICHVNPSSQNDNNAHSSESSGSMNVLHESDDHGFLSKVFVRLSGFENFEKITIPQSILQDGFSDANDAVDKICQYCSEKYKFEFSDTISSNEHTSDELVGVVKFARHYEIRVCDKSGMSGTLHIDFISCTKDFRLAQTIAYNKALYENVKLIKFWVVFWSIFWLVGCCIYLIWLLVSPSKW